MFRTFKTVLVKAAENLSNKIFWSCPVTEDVPPRRDQSIHRVPPSVTGLVHLRNIPLHLTSVNFLHTDTHTCMHT
jgi:hypothetical protein